MVYLNTMKKSSLVNKSRQLCHEGPHRANKADVTLLNTTNQPSLSKMSTIQNEGKGLALKKQLKRCEISELSLKLLAIRLKDREPHLFFKGKQSFLQGFRQM
jgi:hypothetical protein